MVTLGNGLNAAVSTIVAAALTLTIVLLVLRRYAPMLGAPLWRGWCRLLGWAVRAPFRLVRVLIRESRGRRR